MTNEEGNEVKGEECYEDVNNTRVADGRGKNLLHGINWRRCRVAVHMQGSKSVRRLTEGGKNV